jgi:hypothetical protein
MRERGCDIQEAFNELGDEFKDIAQEMEGLISSLEDTADPCAEYARNVGALVFGIMAWSFRCRRYFGTDGPKVMETLTIELLPKVK